MFNLHDFVMETIKKMIGEEPDYKVMQYSLNWFNKGILTEEDLAEIQNIIDERAKAKAAAEEAKKEAEEKARLEAEEAIKNTPVTIPEASLQENTNMV